MEGGRGQTGRWAGRGYERARVRTGLEPEVLAGSPMKDKLAHQMNIKRHSRENEYSLGLKCLHKPLPSLSSNATVPLKLRPPAARFA